MKRQGALFLFLTTVLLLASCAPRFRTVPPDPTNPVFRIAVLPLYNATLDIDGPEVVRKELFQRLRGYHYDVMPLSEVDSLLRERMGITLGSQLDMTTPQEIGKVLGVQALVYGYLLDFDHVTLGLYNVKKVRAGFRLVDTETGRTIWARGRGVKSLVVSRGAGEGITAIKELRDSSEGLEEFRNVPGLRGIPGLTDWYIRKIDRVGSAGDAAIFSLGEKLVEKALRIHMKTEVRRMLDLVMRDFPPGPGR